MGSRGGLPVNTDGMIICLSVVHEKASWSGLKWGKKHERKMEAGLRGP